MSMWGGLIGSLGSGNTSGISSITSGSSGINWGSLLGSAAGGLASSYFGSSGSGGSSGSSNIYGDLFKGILGGLSATAAGKSAEDAAKFNAAQAIALAQTQGLENRKTSSFERDLEYYYKQLDNRNKRVALDTYGAFSKLGTFAPANYTQPAIPVVPDKPVPGA